MISSLTPYKMRDKKNTKNKRKTPPNDLPWTCFFDIMLNGIVYPI